MRDATTVQIRDSFSFWETRFPRADWAAAQTSLFGFLDGLGATEDAHTITVRLVPREIESPRQFVDHLMTETSGDGAWSFVTTTRSSSGEHDGQARMLTYRPHDQSTRGQGDLAEWVGLRHYLCPILAGVRPAATER
jgi:hypothetical protein